MCGACQEAYTNILEVSKYCAFRYYEMVDIPRTLKQVSDAAEGDWYDVHVAPVVIIEKNGEEVKRWDGVAPSVEALKALC